MSEIEISGSLKSSLVYTRDDGIQSFIHDSYKEFFIAKHYTHLVENGVSGIIDKSAPTITRATRDFIREMLSDFPLLEVKYDGKLPPGLCLRNDRYYSEIDEKEMVFVPKGLFIFCSDKKRFGGSYYVWETYDFFIDKFPVTNEEFASFLKKTHYKPDPEWSNFFKDNQDNHPAIVKHPKDAFEYSKWAKKTILREDYWEKAARGVDAREYPWGDVLDQNSRMNCATKFNKDGIPLINVPIIFSTPVNAFPDGMSPYGCVDMCGNAWEIATDLNNKNIVYCGGSHICADFVSHPYSRIDELEFIAPSELFTFRLGMYIIPDVN